MARLEEVAEKLTLANKVCPQRLKPNSKHALTAPLEVCAPPKINATLSFSATSRSRAPSKPNSPLRYFSLLLVV
jgi:hypothetical protein